MSASITDKITDTRNSARPVTTTVSSSRAIGATTLACSSLLGWPTDSKVHFVTYQVDTNLDPIAGTQLDCSGIVSGSSIGSLEIVDGTDGGNSIGDYVEMLPTSAWAQDLADALTLEHDRTGLHTSTAASTLAPLLKAAMGAYVYPVGSIYSNYNVSTNPATLLGFGTWVALESRVLVGKAATGTFDTINKTGGEETHALVEAELAAHAHDYYAGRGSVSYAAGANNAIDSSVGLTGTTTGSKGSGTAHNNLQPYIVIYMWRRTA